MSNGSLMRVNAIYPIRRAALLFAGGRAARTTNRERTIALYKANEAVFAQAAQTGRLEHAERIRGVESVYRGREHIDFACGGSGWGSSTSYYGFFYSPTDGLTAWNGGMCAQSALVPDGGGFRWTEPDGDNAYYVEAIGPHFYYYEARY